MTNWIAAVIVISTLYSQHATITSSVQATPSAASKEIDAPLVAVESARQNVSNTVSASPGYGSNSSNPLAELANELRNMKNDLISNFSLLNLDLAALRSSITVVQTGLDAVKLSVMKCAPKRSITEWPVGTMKPDDFLNVDEKFCSESGKFCLHLQNSGNLILYDTATYKVIWSNRVILGYSCTPKLIMQRDGAAVLYMRGTAVWAGGVAGEKQGNGWVNTDGRQLFFHQDGHICLRYPANSGKTQNCAWSTLVNEDYAPAVAVPGLRVGNTVSSSTQSIVSLKDPHKSTWICLLLALTSLI